MENEQIKPKADTKARVPGKKVETSEDWFAAMMPTLAIAKDYEPAQRKTMETSYMKWNPEPETLDMIRFSDCDPFGHLYNSRYLDYFINARDQHLLEFYSVDSILHSVKYQESWVVKGHQIAYLRPAKPKEEIRIRSRLLDYGESETFVESLMLNHDGRHLKAILWSRFSYINLKSGRLARHPDFIMEILKAIRIEAPAYATRDFELRTRNVIEELRHKNPLPRSLKGIVNR